MTGLPAASRMAPAWVRGAPGRRLMIILRAPGCPYACSFCGFGPLTSHGGKVGADDYSRQLQSVLDQHAPDLAGVDEIDIYNSGNFLSDAEVTAGARVAILRACAERTAARVLVIESRPELISEEKLAPLREALRGAGAATALEVAIGLECFDDTLRARGLRKEFTRDDFTRAVGVLGGAGVDLMAYVMLKPWVMSEEAALRDAASAGAFVYATAKAAGTRARLALEPTFVVPGTELAREFAAGAYRPPSLWMVREAAAGLAALGPLTIGLWDEELQPLAAPASCAACQPRLWESFQRFNLTQRASALDVPACSCRPTATEQG